jgi:nucleotide-binding universal stress UspA family protein
VDVPCRIEVLTDGQPSTEIVHLAQRSPVAVVCMSSHGRGRVSQSLLGGVSAAIVREGTLPVVLVGPHCLPAPTAYEELLVPLDASMISEAILPVATAWARALDMRIQLVQVVDPDAGRKMVDAGVEVGDVTEDAYVASVAAGLRHQGLTVSWEVLHDVHAAHAITAFAADRPDAMVAMTTHGRSGTSLVALGSVATRVVHDGSCPVLLFRPQLPEPPSAFGT